MQEKFVNLVKGKNENKNLKYSILTMGCQLNENDSEKIAGMLEQMGYSYIKDYKLADLVIFNEETIKDTSDYIKDKTMEEVINELLPLIEESGITINAVHLELIVRCLTIMDSRSAWANEEVPDYYMCKIKDSILNGKSLTKSLVFEELSKQLTTLKYGIFEKDGDSLLDALL